MRPASTCFSAAMICASVCRLLLVDLPPSVFADHDSLGVVRTGSISEIVTRDASEKLAWGSHSISPLQARPSLIVPEYAGRFKVAQRRKD